MGSGLLALGLEGLNLGFYGSLLGGLTRLTSMDLKRLVEESRA